MKFKRSCLVLAILLGLISTGASASTKTRSLKPIRTNRVKQVKYQNKKSLIKKVRKRKKRSYKLDRAQLKARNRIAYIESRYRWDASNGKCFGRYQLLPSYLGYRHGHLNMGHKHQVQMADNYVYHRYGTWTNALRFHLAHGWY